MDVKYHKHGIYMIRIKCAKKKMEMGLMVLILVEKV